MADPLSAAARAAAAPLGGGALHRFLLHARRRPAVVRGRTVACGITPILTLMNHSDEIVTLELEPRFRMQTMMTFCMPSAVSTDSSAMQAVADPRRQQGARCG